MTSISQMRATCPNCSTDLLEAASELGIGDAEDIMEIECPSCRRRLNIELVARFEVTTNDEDPP